MDVCFFQLKLVSSVATYTSVTNERNVWTVINITRSLTYTHTLTSEPVTARGLYKASESSWVTLYTLCTPGFEEFILFFLPDPLLDWIKMPLCSWEDSKLWNDFMTMPIYSLSQFYCGRLQRVLGLWFLSWQCELWHLTYTNLCVTKVCWIISICLTWPISLAVKATWLQFGERSYCIYKKETSFCPSSQICENVLSAFQYTVCCWI